MPIVFMGQVRSYIPIPKALRSPGNNSIYIADPAPDSIYNLDLLKTIS